MSEHQKNNGNSEISAPKSCDKSVLSTFDHTPSQLPIGFLQTEETHVGKRLGMEIMSEKGGGDWEKWESFEIEKYMDALRE
jgi:hypothetical protein